MLTAPIRGVVFDLDGTLVRQELDFEAIRREIGLPPGTALLEALARMPERDRRHAEEIIDRHEQTAAGLAVALPGVVALLRELDDVGTLRAILTRNSASAATKALAAAGLSGFDPVIAREDAPFKPDPAGLLAVCRHWRLPPAEVLMVGDYLFDIEAGRAAGTQTALITHDTVWPFADRAGVCFASFVEWPAAGLHCPGRAVL